MKIYTNDLVKGHSDFKVKCLTFGLYTQVSDSGPLGPLVLSVMPLFNTPLRSKGGLCYTPGARPHACAHLHVRARGQNVQYVRLGQFVSNYKG